MANTLYRAAVRELERLLSPRLASQSLHEGLAALGQSADTLRLTDAETILHNRVLPRLTGSLGDEGARTTVESVLGRLAEVAAALRRQASDLVETGLARTEAEVEGQAALVDALAADPSRRDLAWRLGLDAELIDRAKRTTEIRNFLEHLVAPTRAARGRG